METDYNAPKGVSEHMLETKYRDIADGNSESIRGPL